MPDFKRSTAKTHRRVPAMPAAAQVHGLPKLYPAIPAIPVPKGRQGNIGLMKFSLGKNHGLNSGLTTFFKGFVIFFWQHWG
jgi:hypothetical protein